jgi:transposase
MKMIPESAARRAMKVLEVIFKAMAREIKWIQAADILGVTPRTIRRMRFAYQEQGIGGLSDRRRGRPSPRRAPYELVEKVLCLYADKYFDFNVKHFHEQLVGKHGLSCSYTWTKNLLQEAGYVKRSKGRLGATAPREAEFNWLSILSGRFLFRSLRFGNRGRLGLRINILPGFLQAFGSLFRIGKPRVEDQSPLVLLQSSLFLSPGF